MTSRLPWPMILQVLAVAAAVWLFVATWQVWILAFVALIIAAAILPAARAGERWHVPRGLVVLGVYVLAAGVFSLMGRLLWPALSEQWAQFMDQLPKLVENVRGWLGIIDYWLGQWGASLPSPKADKVEGIAGILLGNAMRLTTGVVGAVFELLAVLVIAAYLVIDAREVGHTLLALLPREHRATATRLAPAVLNRIGGYVRGQIVSSFFVGALIAVALALLGVKYALLIGALAAVLNVVPFVGATIATVLATLSALNDGVLRAGITLPVMILCQTIEGKLLAPYFVGRATGLHALAVLVALLAGFHLGGVVGGLVAVPFLAGAWEIVRTLWVEPRRSA
ncbi:MAG TPA: AI-2E family transporter [Patescibacteria group bacterium]|nr:AI-2E family transporter [Patescibacteria group bacterium]